MRITYINQPTWRLASGLCFMRGLGVTAKDDSSSGRTTE